MTFEAYLIEKKIDSREFKANEPDRWQEWALLFEQVSPASFTSQKLYLINPIRRKYPMKEIPKQQTEQTPISHEVQTVRPKPVFKPKIS